MNTKEHALTAIARLLEVMEAAIRLGDWKVDGACDPDAAIEYAKHVLVSGGYAQNSNDDKLDGPGMTPNSPMTTKYLRDVDVAARYGTSRPTIWRWTAAGRFPKPVRLSPGCTRWRLADIEQWEKERGASQ